MIVAHIGRWYYVMSLDPSTGVYEAQRIYSEAQDALASLPVEEVPDAPPSEEQPPLVAG